MSSFAWNGFIFGLGGGLIISLPIFSVACSFFSLPPVIVCPITSGLLGWFFGAAYEWNWGIGWPTGLGSTCAITVSALALQTILMSENELDKWPTLTASLTAVSGLIGNYYGVKSERR